MGTQKMKISLTKHELILSLAQKFGPNRSEFLKSLHSFIVQAKQTLVTSRVAVHIRFHVQFTSFFGQ